MIAELRAACSLGPNVAATALVSVVVVLDPAPLRKSSPILFAPLRCCAVWLCCAVVLRVVLGLELDVDAGLAVALELGFDVGLEVGLDVGFVVGLAVGLALGFGEGLVDGLGSGFGACVRTG